MKWFIAAWAIVFAIIILMVVIANVPARGHDRHYAVTKQEKDWFNGLKSGKGPCCSDADGNVLKDNDWKTKDGKYSVLINNQWIDVPDQAVLKVPNLYGPTMVWLAFNFSGSGKVDIRCFIPGVMM
jgi:hypothetical protein